MLLETAEVLWTARYDYNPGWVVKVHAHEFFQAVYLIDGDGTLTLGGGRYGLRPAHILLAAPGVRHGLEAASRVRTLDIKFRVHDDALAGSLRRIRPAYGPAEPNLRGLFERIWEEGSGRAPFRRQMCAVYLIELLLLLRRTAARRNPATPRCGAEGQASRADMLSAPVANFVREHIAEALTVRRLAAELGCSERSLRHHFHEALGVSPLQYLTQLRIDYAKELIRDSDCALKEAAGKVGFLSIHHFSRVFHHVTGMSPGAWREAHVRGIRKDINVNPQFHNITFTVDGAGLRPLGSASLANAVALAKAPRRALRR